MTQAQAQAADPYVSAWVGASAGTGKTKVLTDRVLRLLLEGASPARLLCLTYTKAAAAEMKNRIHAKLAEWAVMDETVLITALEQLTHQPVEEAQLTIARQLFVRVLDTADGIKIQTIHAFCQMLIRRFPVEADVPPHFQVVDEAESKEWMAEARMSLLSGKLYQEDPKLRDILHQFMWKMDESRFEMLLQSILSDWKKLQYAIEHDGSVEILGEKIYQLLGVEKQSKIVFWHEHLSSPQWNVDKVKEAMQALQTGGKEDQKRAAIFAEILSLDEAQRGDVYELYLKAFLTLKGTPAARLYSKAVGQNYPHVAEFLLYEQERIIRLADQFKSLSIANETVDLLYVANAILSRYQQIKTMHVRLDYQDLVHKAIKLLCESNSAQWVLYKLDGGIDHILIDEAQDTSPEQWRVAKAMCDEFFAGNAARDTNRTLFVVGDEKQSIYSFQGADPHAFNVMHGELKAKCVDADKTWRTVPLERSFRSTQAVLDVVDEVFARAELKGAVTQSEAKIKHEAHRANEPGRVELWPLVEAEKNTHEKWPLPKQHAQQENVHVKLANHIADKVQQWLYDGRILPAKNRAVQPKDILILLQKRGKLAAYINKALKARNIPVAGADRLVVTEHLAVKDMLAAAAFLLLPQDDLNLAVVLKSPLIGLSEEMLMQLAAYRGKKSLWEALTAKQGDMTYSTAYQLLSDWLKQVDFLSPFELFSHMLEASGVRQRLIARLGKQVEDPLNEFLQQVLLFEQTHIPSLQLCLKWLKSSAPTIKRDMEQGANEVRVMTVHGSKGLQAPIVFLADAHYYDDGKKDTNSILWLSSAGEHPLPFWATRKDDLPQLLLDALDVKKHARWDEYYRLLYVAMTRAEDELYVVGVGKTQEEGDDTPAKKKDAEIAEQAYGQSWYDVIKQAVAPLAQLEDDGAMVVAKGIVECHAVGHIKEQEVVTNKTEFPVWVQQVAPQEPTPPKPLSPSQLSEEEEQRALTSPLATQALQRGKWLHHLLQYLPEMAAEKHEQVAESYLKQVGMAARERNEVIPKLLSVLQSEVFSAIFQQGSKAEVPIVGKVGKFVVSGQIDRLYIGEKEILLIDYKTNRSPANTEAEIPAAYVKQMAAYAALLRDIYPQKQVKAALLWVQTPALMPISNALLEKYIPSTYIERN